MENQSTYRIRTKLGETEPINIPISLMQKYDSFELLSLKLNMNESYRSYESTEGIVVGRVSTANNGLGIPNVRVSIFVPKGRYDQTDEEQVIYPFSSPTDKDGDRVRYNLLPSETDVDCYQVIGTFPTKRRILDNETVCEVFEKYYKYTTVTNEAGDFMLTNIPVGKQRIHIDADLSDIGPFLSQRPYDMIENLGFEKNKFDSTRQFKTSKDLDSLAQVISQTKSVYVYPYWGDMTEYSSDLKITRTDLSLNYEFKTNAIFIGSIITDKQSNAIRHNCTATENAGKMSDMVTGPGRIEMIRKTVDNKIEQYRIKGDMLINDNGVWCYMIPMNLDYVRTDEYGNIIPTDDPNKGVPTRARVRFRVTLNQMDSDEDAYKRCSYLVPNNPKSTDEKFLKENDADYSFGSDTWDESFVDLFWNKVYTVKSYVPRIQKTLKPTNRKHTGIKMTNHYGDNNPFPYNDLSIKLTFLYRLICVIVKIFINLIFFINVLISTLGALPCWLANIKLPFIGRPFGALMKFVPTCIALSAEFCDDGINKNVTYPGCNVFNGCIWKETKSKCEKEQYEAAKNGEEQADCTTNTGELITCVENQLAQQNDATSFNFSNDWINGCLYMPLWYRHIRPKKSFFFGLFKRSARDQWCSSENTFSDLKIAKFCSHSNSKRVSIDNYKGERNGVYYITSKNDDCGDSCHETRHTIDLSNGVIINRENSFGQKVWYYKAVEINVTKDAYPTEYTNYKGQAMVAKTLYATDIVLLGSMNDCDLNGIPKFYNYLKASTYNMPTDILFSDTEFSYSFDENGNFLAQDAHKTSVAAGCDWGNDNEYGYDDGGLFYGIGCSSSEVKTASCINLRRICELGVGQDEMQYIENLNVSINSENDTLDLANTDYQLRPDGFVSYDDIIDFNYRSMFATMNGNRLKTKINTSTGVKEYDFRYLYIDNFDGALEDYMKDEQTKNRERANYRYNYNLEKTCNDYLTFRMGDNPYYYDGKISHSLPKYENSFYFYFGLKEGKTAIDLFNEQYNGPCSTKSDEEEAIDYGKKANGWCCIDSDNEYTHKSYDGYLTLNLENLTMPCSIVFNSKDNSSVTYTVNGSVVNEKICFYGDGLDADDNKSVSGYTRYFLQYENSSLGVTADECYMLNNGTYTMSITDGEGNQYSYVINLKGKYLEFDDVETPFKQPNNVLLKYYKTTGGKYSSIPYHSVSKTPSSNSISITCENDGTPTVVRNDEEMTNVVNKSVISGKYVKLNGTICLYNFYYDNTKLNDYLIEVEPYEKDSDGNYVDDDFWSSATDKNKTWYAPKLMVAGGTEYSAASTSEINGKIYVTKNGDSAYFNQLNVTYGDDESKVTNPYVVIKCPKGGVDYRVKVTQLCKDNGGYFKSNNYVEKKINVSEPTPYKLYINDVDYEMIKKFDTGYVLQSGDNLQTGEELNPFNGFGTSSQNSSFDKIKGWLQISNIVNPYYDWEVDEDTYGKNSLTVEDLNKSENATIKENREEFINKMKSAFWLQCEGSDMAVTYSVRTDDVPYNIWTVYNEEETSKSDEDYNETKSNNGAREERDKWFCKGESVVSIGGIKIPTITSYSSVDFGIENDSIRQGMRETYSADKKICFAQDNVAENSYDSGGISIKPPYLVACVNNDGITIPENLKKGECYGERKKTSGLKIYEFGDSDGNQKKLKSGDYQFFGFHLIDKIFAPNIVCWSYINSVPYYIPWEEYTVTASDENKLGYSIKMSGILSGYVNNGTSNSGRGNFVTDFEEKNTFLVDTPLKTLDDEDDIPTRRLILYYGTESGSQDSILYQNYKITTDVTEGNQYRSVPNTQGEMSFSDSGGNCELTRTLYGSMKVRLLSTTINEDAFSSVSIFGHRFDTGTGENGDKSLTLRVGCTSGDTEKPITYYLFRVTQRETLTSATANGVCWYPLNKISCDTTQDEQIKYSLDCECSGNNASEWIWNGGDSKAAHIFNKNTVESRFKDFISTSAKSSISYTDENGETQSQTTDGYGQTGVFNNLSHFPYFVVAVTNNNCRAISPVYDFHVVYYVAGLLEVEGAKVLRTALVYVLRGKGYDKDTYSGRIMGQGYVTKDVDKNEDYGVVSSFNGYCKKVRNYYLTRYNFTISYTFTNGTSIVTNDGVTYEKTDDVFVNSKEELNNDDNIGKSYSEKSATSTKDEYILYVNTGGTLVVGEETQTKPTAELITSGSFYYTVVQSETDESGKHTVKYQKVTIDEYGNVSEDSIVDEKPTDVRELSDTYYITYTKTETSEEGTETTVTCYKTITYTKITQETVNYNPRIPYFMRYNDKSLTDDEYNSLKSAFYTASGVENIAKFYVTDVTGLKHRCKLYSVVKNSNGWNTLMTVPS